MTSNQTYNVLIVDVLEALSQEGVTNLCPSLERPFNELMKIEREQVLCAAPRRRSDLAQRLNILLSFKAQSKIDSHERR